MFNVFNRKENRLYKKNDRLNSESHSHIRNTLSENIKYLYPLIYDIYLKDISLVFWPLLNLNNSDIDTNIELMDVDLSDKTGKHRYQHYTVDILDIVMFYLGTLLNVRDNKNFFFLDYLEFDSIKYNKIRNKGGLHSEFFIKEKLKNKLINEKSIYLAAEKGDIKFISLALCHPNIKIKVRVEDNNSQYKEIMNFYNYKNVINKLISSYSNVGVGVNVHGICNKCEKYSIVNLGCDPTTIDDRDNIKLFDIPYILDMIPCNCNMGFLNEDEIEMFGIYKCNFIFIGKKCTQKHKTQDFSGYAELYRTFDFCDKNRNILWKSFQIEII